MWSHSAPRNIVSLQLVCAIKQIDRRIADAWRDGYGPEADTLLERRLELKRCLETGQVPGASESQ